MEQWKPIPKEPFSRYYEVSDCGNVRRGGRNLVLVTVRGYHHVLLQCEGQKWMTRTHILVALAFIGEPPGPIGVTGWTVNHKDFDRLNNRSENLEWMTAADNHTHAVKAGRKSRGERHYKSVLTAEIVRQMRAMRADGMKVREIAAHFGHKEHIASDVLLGRCWAHVT